MVSTLVFMTFFGVYITVALTLGLLVVLGALIGWRMEGHNRLVLMASALGLYIVAINSPAAVKAYNCLARVRSGIPCPASAASGRSCLPVLSGRSSHLGLEQDPLPNIR